MLANQKTKAVAEARVPTLMTIVICSGCGSLGIGRTKGLRFPSKLLDRAEADAVGLPESAVNGASLGHAHLGASNERRNVRRIGIAVTNKPFRTRALIHSGFENPASEAGIGELLFESRSDSDAVPAFRYA
jgi:hypothetical protein